MNGGGRDLVGRIENILPFHAGIKELTEAPGVSVRQFLDENAALFKENLILKSHMASASNRTRKARLARKLIWVLSVRWSVSTQLH